MLRESGSAKIGDRDPDFEFVSERRAAEQSTVPLHRLEAKSMLAHAIKKVMEAISRPRWEFSRNECSAQWPFEIGGWTYGGGISQTWRKISGLCKGDSKFVDTVVLRRVVGYNERLR